MGVEADGYGSKKAEDVTMCDPEQFVIDLLEEGDRLSIGSIESRARGAGRHDVHARLVEQMWRDGRVRQDGSGRFFVVMADDGTVKERVW